MAEVLTWYRLMKLGWDVYRAISPSSPADVMAHKNGFKIRVEVRTGRWRENSFGERRIYYAKNKGRREEATDYYAVVLHDTEEVIFEPPLPD